MRHGDISIFDEDDVKTVTFPDATPNVEFMFAGRYRSDEYVPMENENGTQDMMHKVTLNLVLDNSQFVALMTKMSNGEPVSVKLV